MREIFINPSLSRPRPSSPPAPRAPTDTHLSSLRLRRGSRARAQTPELEACTVRPTPATSSSTVSLSIYGLSSKRPHLGFLPANQSVRVTLFYFHVSRSQVPHEHSRLLGALAKVRGAEQHEPVLAAHHARGLVAALDALAARAPATRVFVHLVAVDVGNVGRVPGRTCMVHTAQRTCMMTAGMMTVG